MAANIFMTGGAGFLGRAILRRYASEWPDVHFTIYSRDEAKQARVRQLYPQHRYVLGDVRDADRLEIAMAGHDVIIHAAAMKYVPQGETDVSEAISVNVDGSRNVCKAAIRNRVSRVIGVSTDKACRPVNVYGVTKLLMERLFQEAAQYSQTIFTCLRYGNVVSSTGSVIPLFRQQAREGCISLTNPAMTRFWLRIEDAIDLVDMGLEETGNGTILVPRARSLSMAGVATAVSIIECGGSVQHPPPVDRRIIGQRFGEKIHEELVSPVETIYTEMVDGGMTMRMYPVIQGARDHQIAGPYTSESPDLWLSTSEMIEWIRQAPE